MTSPVILVMLPLASIRRSEARQRSWQVVAAAVAAPLGFFLDLA
jgi:hypothetical protein